MSAGHAYEKVVEGVTVNSAASTCIRVEAPFRAILQKLLVKQVSEGLAGFNVDVYSRAVACDLSISLNEDDVLPAAPEMFKIIPTEKVAVGKALLELYNLDAPYENQDPLVKGFKENAIYIEITPAGIDAKDFDISYAMAISDLG